jgi:hypothetical protein
MSRVKVLVEGQTEETFINQLLYGHLAQQGIFISPILLTTKRVRNRSSAERALPGRRFKGGISNYPRVKMDVRNALNDRQAIVTTMIDFYGLPGDFPGMNNLPSGSGRDQVVHLEATINNDIDSTRFRAFITLHEYEALLFSQPLVIADAFPEQQVGEQLQTIRNGFRSPEEINRGNETHPAKRITNLVTGYRKPVHGTLIARRIGLSRIRQECSHFNAWLTWLESLPPAT